ncbi:hypothetical protein OQA88_1505 [Cercophora sp. LCS_1]
MPARKSDARRSDVSVARFVLADGDDGQVTPAASAEPPVPAATSVPPQAPSTQASSPNEKKDKEKEKEKDKEREREKEREKERDAITIEDLTLPKSIITRLAKGVLPPNTQIQANAILALSKSATVFVNHLAASANELTTSANKKTIMPQDVFKALDETEFGFMRERVEAEFAKFNEVQTSKRSTYRKKVAALKKAAVSGDGASAAGDVSMMSTASHDPNETETSMMRSDPGEPSRAAKKARIDPSNDESRMEVDDHEPSDAETVPDEHEEEEEDDDDDEEEDDDVEEEEEDEEDEADPDRDGDEERAPTDEDEALDEDSE